MKISVEDWCEENVGYSIHEDLFWKSFEEIVMVDRIIRAYNMQIGWSSIYNYMLPSKILSNHQEICLIGKKQIPLVGLKPTTSPYTLRSYIWLNS